MEKRLRLYKGWGRSDVKEQKSKYFPSERYILFLCFAGYFEPKRKILLFLFQLVLVPCFVSLINVSWKSVFFFFYSFTKYVMYYRILFSFRSCYDLCDLVYCKVHCLIQVSFTYSLCSGPLVRSLMNYMYLRLFEMLT